MIKIGNRRLLIKKDDLTTETTDAIVNPANGGLMHGGGAARAIVVNGGFEIQRQSNEIIKRIGALPVGKAVITEAGLLPCKFVIHTVGPQMGEGDESAKLKRAVLNSLRMADLYNLKSVAMPAISSGIFGFPKPECAKILLETTAEFLKQSDISIEEVVMCNHDEETFQIFLNQEKLLFVQE